MRRGPQGGLLAEFASNSPSLDHCKLTKLQTRVLLGMAEEGGPLGICEMKRRFGLVRWKTTVHPLVQRALLKKMPFTDVYQITSRGRARAKKEEVWAVDTTS